MKTIPQMVEVMLAFEEGQKVEGRLRDTGEWMLCQAPSWNWDEYDYRIAAVKPDPVCLACTGDTFRCEGCVAHSNFNAAFMPKKERP